MLKFGRILVYLRYWTLNVMSLMVYPKVIFIPMFSIKASSNPGTQAPQNGCRDLNLRSLHAMCLDFMPKKKKKKKMLQLFQPKPGCLAS